MSWEDIKIEISDAVKKIIEERHVSPDEVKMVINHVEREGGIKLYLPDANRYLGKNIIGNATFYADYSNEGDKYIINSAYAHRAEIQG
jgi:Mor family transcriptional regulator